MLSFYRKCSETPIVVVVARRAFALRRERLTEDTAHAPLDPLYSCRHCTFCSKAELTRSHEAPCASNTQLSSPLPTQILLKSDSGEQVLASTTCLDRRLTVSGTTCIACPKTSYQDVWHRSRRSGPRDHSYHYLSTWSARQSARQIRKVRIMANKHPNSHRTGESSATTTCCFLRATVSIGGSSTT